MSTTELEEAVRGAGEQWQTKTNGVLTIRDRCTKCWRGDNEHPDRAAVGLVCGLRRLTPSAYFDELAIDFVEAERAGVLYSKGLVDDDVVDQMERHIEELEGQIRVLKDSRNRRQRRQRRRRRRRRHDGVDATRETTGDEASEEESVGEHPCSASSAVTITASANPSAPPTAAPINWRLRMATMFTPPAQ